MYRYLWVAVVIGWMLLLPVPALAANDIILDGRFSDWNGQASLDDPQGDVLITDIAKFSWATNDNASNLYFMIQRYISGYSILDRLNSVYKVYFDINNNGNYGDPGDRYLSVTYNPVNGRVDVNLCNPNGTTIKSYYGTWGEASSNGAGSRAEFSVSMEDLGMYPAQPIRMYATGTGIFGFNDRVPDKGDVQWSPISIIPTWALPIVFVIGLGVAIMIFKKRRMA